MVWSTCWWPLLGLCWDNLPALGRSRSRFEDTYNESIPSYRFDNWANTSGKGKVLLVKKYIYIHIHRLSVPNTFMSIHLDLHSHLHVHLELHLQ